MPIVVPNRGGGETVHYTQAEVKARAEEFGRKLSEGRLTPTETAIAAYVLSKSGKSRSKTERAKIPVLYYEQEDGSMVVPNGVGHSSFAQSNAGIDEHGNHFHAVDNPRTGETTVTLYNPTTGERTVTVRPRRSS